MIRFMRLIFMLIVIAGVVMGTYLWMARIPTLERFISHKINVRVEIDDVSVGLNQLTIKGLKIYNPSSSSTTYALQVKEVAFQTSLLELIKPTIHIDSLLIRDPLIAIELYNALGTDNNWCRLLNDVSSGDERHFTVDKIQLVNTRFVAKRTGKEFALPPLPYLELKANKPLCLSHLGKLIFRSVFSTAKPLTSILESISEPQPKESFEKAKKIVHDGYELLKKKTKDASNYIQHLLHFNRPQHNILPS